MAIDPNASPDTQPSGSLPPTLLNPDDASYFKQPPGAGSLPPTKWQAASFDPNAPTPTPAPAPPPAPVLKTGTLPQPSLPPPAPPGQQPATAPPTPLTPPAAPAAAAPAAAPPAIALGDSIAAGLAQNQKFHETYEGRDLPEARANTGIMAASGRTTRETLTMIDANKDKLAGQTVYLSSGISNDLNGGVPLEQALKNVKAQLDLLGPAQAKVMLLGVGAGVRDAQAANAALAKLAQAYNIPFSGELAGTQATATRPAAVHPSDPGALIGQFGGPKPGTPGTGKTIDDATAFIQQKEGGGDFVLYGHTGQAYDPKTMPTRPGYYGFPEWAGGYGPDGRQTHAAGGAQWEPDTWKNAVEGYIQTNHPDHTPDFRNPADQKAVFNYWAARRYKEQTGRDIVADLNAGHVDWSALGSEWSSLKNAGTGGIAGMTASNLPTYQQYRELSQQQRDLLQQEIGTLQKSIAGMEAGDPKQRALADQLMQKQLQLMDKYEDMIAHPPTQKPTDMIANFGSIATLIGIFAGRFAHRPMVASLNAAGAAMQAMNENNYEQYQNAFNQWKTQASMTQNLLQMESGAYKNIMDDRKTTMEEKFKLLDAQMHVFQNAQGIIASERGDYDKQWEIAQKTQEMADRHDAHVKQLVEANEKQEQDTALRGAVASDDQKWITDNPDAYQAWIKDHPERVGTTPPEVHFDHLTARQGQQRTATKAGTQEAVQVTWADGKTELLYGQRGAPGHFVTESGRDVDLSSATKVLPLTKSQAGSAGMTLPDYQGPKQWEGMPSKPPPNIRRDVWSMALDWARTGKQPSGWGRMDQGTREELQQAYPVAQDALGIKPEDEYQQSIKYAAEKARQEAIERAFGGGVLGRNLVALNTVADHISLFRQYADALRNGDVQRVNQLQNRLATEAGSPEMINFALAGRITGDEVVRLLTTTGGTVTDREDIAKQLASYDSPEQLEGAADTLTNFVRSRYSPLRQQYARGEPGAEQYFDEHMVTPEARQLFTGPQRPIDPNNPNAPTPTPTPAATPTTAAPAPPATPPRPTNLPPGSQYSPSRNQWRDPDGKTYDAQGHPL